MEGLDQIKGVGVAQGLRGNQRRSPETSRWSRSLEEAVCQLLLKYQDQGQEEVKGRNPPGE